MVNNFSGTIYMTSDINMVQNNINSCKVLMVTNEPLFQNHPNRVAATILLPPTQAIIADADDDMQTFEALYYNYLISDEVTEFISIVLYVLYTGVNVLIYIPSEDVKSLSYVGFLLEFLKNNYGIQVGTDAIPYLLDINYLPMIVDMLYLNELISYKDVIMSFSISMISDMSICKMYADSNPYTRCNTPQEMRQYFTDYQNRIINNNNVFMESVVSYRKE